MGLLLATDRNLKVKKKFTISATFTLLPYASERSSAERSLVQLNSCLNEVNERDLLEMSRSPEIWLRLALIGRRG